MLADREITNGAFLQFLCNHGRQVSLCASRAMEKIGAHRMAAILDSCQSLVDEHFPSEGKLPEELRLLLPNEIIGRDGRTIKEAGSILPEAVLTRILELSYEYMSYPDPLGDLAQKYYGPYMAEEKSGRAH